MLFQHCLGKGKGEDLWLLDTWLQSSTGHYVRAGVVGKKRACALNCGLEQLHERVISGRLLGEHGDELLPTKLCICSASSMAFSLLPYKQ